MLLEGEDGPRDRYRRLQDTLEEVKEEGTEDESAREAWDIDIQCAWSGMEEGCEQILDAVQGIAFAKARLDSREEQGDPAKRLAKLGTGENQALMAERLVASRQGR